MKLLVQSLADFPTPETPAWERRPGKFLSPSSWSDGRKTPQARIPIERTIRELTRELEHLGVEEAVLEVDVSATAIRRSGWSYTNSTRTPRVALSFVHPQQGPTRIPADRFDDWRDNVRAIRLALEALRTIDRYGITRRAEQYRGWAALPAQSSAGLNIAAAARVLVAYDPGTRSLDSKGATVAAERIIASVDTARKALRAAAVATHPDSEGGSTGAFQSVQSARVALAAHFSTTL